MVDPRNEVLLFVMQSTLMVSEDAGYDHSSRGTLD